MRVHIEWPTLTIHIYLMLTGVPPRVHARVRRIQFRRKIWENLKKKSFGRSFVFRIREFTT